MGKKYELHIIRVVEKLYPGHPKEYWEDDFSKFNQEHSSIHFIYFQGL